MMQEITLLIFVSLGVFLIPFVAPLFRLPVAVGELLYGIALLYLFRYIGIQESVLGYLDFLAFLGFSLLMFLAGLEIDWNKLESLKGKEKFVILAVVATNFLISFLLVKLFSLSYEVVLLLGALGIGLMLSVLRELEVSEYLKQVLLLTGSLGEVVTLFGLTLYDLYLSFGLGREFYYHLFLIGLFGFLFILLLRVIRLLIWYFPERVASLILTETKAAIDIRASFALLFLFMAFTSLIHIEPILGAFIAGTLLGFIFREKEQFEGKLASLGYGFLIPFFFIQVGFSFDLSYLKGLFLKLSFLLWAALFVVKLLSSFWFKLLGFSLREIVLSALLFSFPFTILIAVGKILYEKGVWHKGDFVVVTLLTILTSISFPLLVKVFFSPSRD